MALKDCCQREAVASLEKHKDIAICDGCGYLLLAYGDKDTYNLTLEELASKGATFDKGVQGPLWVVAKQR